MNEANWHRWCGKLESDVEHIKSVSDQLHEDLKGYVDNTNNLLELHNTRLSAAEQWQESHNHYEKKEQETKKFTWDRIAVIVAPIVAFACVVLTWWLSKK